MKCVEPFSAKRLAIAAGALAATAVLVVVPWRVSAEEPAKAKQERGSETLREIRRKSAPILAAMGKEHGYRLNAGQDLRRVPPPFAPVRMEYYRTGNPGQAAAIPAGPSAMIFHERAGRLTGWGMTFGDGEGYTLQNLLDSMLGIKSSMIEGGEVLEQRIPGDWVVRVGAKDDQLLGQLETILQKELSLPVRIEWREIQRPVYVARGTYRFTPIEGGRTQQKLILAVTTIVTDPIEIFGKELVPNSGAGGGSGDFKELLQWLGDWVGKPIVSEVTAPPANKFSWHLHARSPFTAQMRDEDHDPMLVLPNITAQTGLTFTVEQRSVKTLFVEQAQ